jgi:DNA gyrase subunit B
MSDEATARANADYGVEHIQHLQNAAHIRHRPGMYIGNTGASGLHHLVYELVYNSIDEALAGFCTTITVRLDVDGSCTVEDDGRGIPVEEHPEEKVPTLQVVMTMLGTSGKFDNKAYKVSAGLHGMGSKAVTALSDWTVARVRRNGRTYEQQYERGVASSELSDIGASSHSGTTITFHPDPQIFHDATFSFETLEERIRELAFLNKGVLIHLIDARVTPNQETRFQFHGGIAEFVEYMNKDEEVDHKPIYLQKDVEVEAADGQKPTVIKVEVALQYAHSEVEQIRCYANNAYNPGGGTHLTGFRTALTRTFGAYAAKNEMVKEGIKLEGQDFREGLTAVVSVQLPNPHFESQTKIKLNNPEVDGAVQTAVGQFIATYLEEHPKEAKKLVDRIVLSAEARIAARKAKEAITARKNALSGGGLPGKLMDCTTRNRDESELFLVEGQSAGGTADSGRDRHFQAILPLRGKVLNVEKARVEKLLANEEITNLISAIGIDIGNVEDLTKLRYGKLIILTDADVDGQHIRTLLLTFFFRQMRRLVEEGHVYVARPPLYSVTHKKQVRYVQTIPEMQRELMERGLKDAKLSVFRGEGTHFRDFAGDELTRLVAQLGELEEQLQIVERRGLNLSALLDGADDKGLPLFHVVLAGKEHWFRTAQEVDQFRQQEGQRRGRDLVVAEVGPSKSADHGANGNGSQPAEFFLQELHEVRGINRHLDKLKEFGLGPPDLVPPRRIAGREPPVRFILEGGDTKKVLTTLRELVTEIRRLGEKGIAVTRFKGLGEMNDDQLWQTTLDPAARTLMRVTLEDAVKAEQMFRVLMGEKVEPRREFIQKHALEVKEIDYHGA